MKISHLLISILLFSAQLFAEVQNYKLFGFTQVDFTTSSAATQPYGFQLRRLNLIQSYKIGKHITIIADAEYEGSPSHNNTSKQGTIKLSRAFIDYCLSEKINFRIGRYLNPFGLYNEVHDFGASFYLVDAPRLYQKHTLYSGNSQRFFNKYGTGVQIFGKLSSNSNGGALNYAVSLSNGRDENQKNGSDIDKTSAINAHIFYRPSFFGIQYGLSYNREKLLKGIGGISGDFLQTVSLEFEWETDKFLLQLETALSQFKNPSAIHQNALLNYVHLAYLRNEKLVPYIEFAYELNDTKNTADVYEETIIGTSIALESQLFLKPEVAIQSKEASNIETNDVTYKLSLNAMF